MWEVENGVKGGEVIRVEDQTFEFRSTSISVNLTWLEWPVRDRPNHGRSDGPLLSLDNRVSAVVSSCTGP